MIASRNVATTLPYDTGLLLAMHDYSLKAAVVDNALRGPMKGSLYESLITCAFASKGIPIRC